MKFKQRLGAILLGILLISACSSAPKAADSTKADPWQLTQIGSMTVDRATHQATLLPDGQVLVTGGCSGTGCEEILASAELFNPRTGSFQPIFPMREPRAGHDATALSDGRVLVTGGWTGTEATASAEIYEPDTGDWTPVGDMNIGRSSHIAVLLPDGRVLIIGGGSGGLAEFDSAEIFDPATSTFRMAGRMSTNHYLATSLADGRVLLTGGQTAAGEISPAAEIYDPAENEFQPTGAMAVPRVKHAAALLTDGRILVIGGSDERGYAARFNSTEFYDPTSGTFAPGPDLRWGRHKIRDAVVVLPSGATLIAGGAIQAEVYDPELGRFLPVTGELDGPQMFATATLLLTGEVLILGGYDDRTRSSAAAWLMRAAP